MIATSLEFRENYFLPNWLAFFSNPIHKDFIRTRFWVVSILGRQLCVKGILAQGILAQDLGFVGEPSQWGFGGFSG